MIVQKTWYISIFESESTYHLKLIFNFIIIIMPYKSCLYLLLSPTFLSKLYNPLSIWLSIHYACEIKDPTFHHIINSTLKWIWRHHICTTQWMRTLTTRLAELWEALLLHIHGNRFGGIMTDTSNAHPWVKIWWNLDNIIPRNQT